MAVKSRRQGTSMIITIPAEFGVSENVKYEPKMLTDGTIQFIPVQEDFPEIWNDDPEAIKAFNAEIGMQDDGVNHGRENVTY